MSRCRRTSFTFFFFSESLIAVCGYCLLGGSAPPLSFQRRRRRRRPAAARTASWLSFFLITQSVRRAAQAGSRGLKEQPDPSRLARPELSISKSVLGRAPGGGMADCRGFTLAARPESDFEDGFEPLLGNAGSETPPRPCAHPRAALVANDFQNPSPLATASLHLSVPARAAGRRGRDACR